MAGRYCSSNIKFNMDDENQRITWEFLKQSCHKKDGSYAKILSDAFVKTMKISAENRDTDPMVLPADVAQKIIDEVVVHLSEISNSTAKGQSHETIKIMEVSDENNASQDIPAGMLDFFMGMGT